MLLPGKLNQRERRIENGKQKGIESMRKAKQAAAERPVVITEENKDFAELMEEVANLEPTHRERVALYMQGYVAAVNATGTRATA